MARVPQHFRDKLVSSQTPLNSLDNSSAQIAQGIGALADTFQQGILKLEDHKRQELMKAQGAKKKAEFLTKYAEAAHKIKKNFSGDPEAGYEALQLEANKIKEDVLSGVKDSGFHSDLSTVLDGHVAQQSIGNKTWQLKQMDVLAQQLRVDALSGNIAAITEGVTAEQYRDMVEDPDFSEDIYIDTYGAEKGPKMFQEANNAMFRARASYFLDEGQMFAAQEFIEQAEGPDAKTRAEQEKSFLKAQKGLKARRFFQTVSSVSVDTVEDAENVIADRATISELQDKLMGAIASIDETEDVEEKSVIAERVKILADLRDIKLEQTLLNSPGSIETESELQSDYDFLFFKEKGQMVSNPSAFLSEFLGFQRQVVEAAKNGQVTAENFNKWMFWSKVALQGQVDEMAEEGAGLAPGRPGDRFDQEPKMRNMVKDFVSESQGKTSPWRSSVLDYVYRSMPSQDLEKIGDAVLGELFEKGKRFASLKELGYPVDILNSQVIKTPAGVFPIAGYDTDGTPLVTVDTEKLEANRA